MMVKATEIEVRVRFDDGQELALKLEELEGWECDQFNRLVEDEANDQPEIVKLRQTGHGSITLRATGRWAKPTTREAEPAMPVPGDAPA
jgi:hypothetical protein